MKHTVWLLPEIFDQIWNDNRNYLICEHIADLDVGDGLRIEEGDSSGQRSTRELEARVLAYTPAGDEGLPRDLMVVGISVTAKRSSS